MAKWRPDHYDVNTVHATKTGRMAFNCSNIMENDNHPFDYCWAAWKSDWWTPFPLRMFGIPTPSPGMVFQNPDNHWGKSVEDDVAFGLENQDFLEKKWRREWLNLGVSRYARLKKRNQPFTCGQKQRVAMVAAALSSYLDFGRGWGMCWDPEGRSRTLDSDSSRDLWKTIRRQLFHYAWLGRSDEFIMSWSWKLSGVNQCSRSWMTTR